MFLLDNKSMYDDVDVVKSFTSSIYLEKPEIAILYKYEDKIRHGRMLDIGVGTGRTTYYFSKIAGEYTGIDYVEGMIDAAKKSYPDINLEVCDVRNMARYPDSYYDFVLFSYNGLDYINHEDRLKALGEIKRVMKPGGVFLFSTHNLQYVDKLFSFKISTDPIVTIYNIRKHLLLRLKNNSLKEIKNKNHATIIDEALNFKLQTYYIEPEEQIKQLTEIGFKNIITYSVNDGFEIKLSDLKNNTESWIHYLAEK
jgi:ubiquinone/menaquinone biosynthesis C-methylase UbiE